MRTESPFPRRRFFFWPPGIFTAVLLAVLAWNSFAEDSPSTSSLGHVKNFLVPDYYPPPNQNQMKSLLRGAEAEPQPNRCVLIKELRVETYRVDGALELTVHAPECTYDSIAQTASSATHIEATKSDGSLLIEGEGFFWQQTNSTFFISNRVHTVVYAQPATPKQP